MAKKKDYNIIEINGQAFTLMERIESNTKVREIPYKIKELVEEIDDGLICRDALIQRTDDQWTRKQKSKLIESILADRPIGSILTALGRSESRSYTITSLIDGLQRTTAIVDYVHNEFTLDKKAKPVLCRFRNDDGEVIEHSFDVAGKKFNQLPDTIKNFILQYRLTIYKYEGFTDDELDDVVFCTNNGKTPTSYQKLRFQLGSDNMRLIQPICDSNLWEDVAGCKAKNDSILCCVIRSLMMMTHYNYTNLGAASMMSFVDEENFNKYVTTHDIEELKTLVEQLSEIKDNMTEEEKEFFDSCSIPHLLMNLKKFNSMRNPENKEYIDFIRAFINSEEKELYDTFSRSGSGNKQYAVETVVDRQYILDDYLDDYLCSVPLKTERNENDGIFGEVGDSETSGNRTAENKKSSEEESHDDRDGETDYGTDRFSDSSWDESEEDGDLLSGVQSDIRPA